MTFRHHTTRCEHAFAEGLCVEPGCVHGERAITRTKSARPKPTTRKCRHCRRAVHISEIRGGRCVADCGSVRWGPKDTVQR